MLKSVVRLYDDSYLNLLAIERIWWHQDAEQTFLWLEMSSGLLKHHVGREAIAIIEGWCAWIGIDVPTPKPSDTHHG